MQHLPFLDGPGGKLLLAGQYVLLATTGSLGANSAPSSGFAAQPAVHVEGGALALAHGLDDDGRAQDRLAAGEDARDAGRQGGRRPP